MFGRLASLVFRIHDDGTFRTSHYLRHGAPRITSNWKSRHARSGLVYVSTMPGRKSTYTTIVENGKFDVHVLDPKDDRRDNIRLTLHSDDGQDVHHHLRTYEVVRLITALQDALAFGPDIPKR